MENWSKHWQDPERATLLNEDVWFKKNQELLLQMANTSFGRSLLEIPQDYPRIWKIRKNCVHALKSYNRITGAAECVADFRIGAKFANVIRTRWPQFQSYARYFIVKHPVIESPLLRQALSVVADSGTFYPDPSAETTSVDGFVGYAAAVAWATAHDALTGTTASDSVDYIDTSSELNVTYSIFRSFLLFDTSALPDTAVISAATIDCYLRNTAGYLEDGGDAKGYVTFTSSSPASNTAIVTADFDAIGSTKLSNDIDLGSLTTSAYNTFTLNASGIANISTTGVSKFGQRMGNDIENVAPTVSLNEVAFTSADKAGTTEDPKLIVTYTLNNSSMLLFF